MSDINALLKTKTVAATIPSRQQQIGYASFTCLNSSSLYAATSCSVYQKRNSLQTFNNTEIHEIAVQENPGERIY